MFLSYLLLFIGVFACSTSGVMIRLSASDSLVLTAFRLLTGALILLPVFLAKVRAAGGLDREQLRRTRLPSLVLAIHLITWTVGVRMTALAQASLIVNLVPIAMPFFLLWLASERINRAEVAGTALAIAGVLVLSIRDARAGGGSLAGDALCFFSMILFALYLSLGRRNRDLRSIWLYVVPVYAQAGLICLLIALPRIHGFAWGSAREWAIMVALGAIPTVCGHSILNRAMRRIRGQVVSLCNATQFVYAGLMSYLIFAEVPKPIFYPACAIVLLGLVIVVRATPPAQTDPISEVERDLRAR